MLFGLLKVPQKWVIGLLIILSIVCLVAVFGARLPEEEVCINLTRWQAGNVHQLIYDLTSGRSTRESRYFYPPASINSPDNTMSVNLKLVPNETDLYDLYLQTGDWQTRPRLLQHAILFASGNLNMAGEQLRWSRDNKRVAYLWSNSDKDFFLSVANVDNDEIKTVTPFAKDPTKAFYTHLQEWSDDNRYISVIDQLLNYTHYTFWDTETLTPIAYPLSETSMVRGVWSPKGHLFASILRDENQNPTHLMILNPEQSNAVIQVPLPQIDIQHLMWSPDGNTLVIGYLTCKEANCHQQWHYSLFQSDGTSLAADLAGSFVNSSNIGSNTVYSADGRTTYSGYPFNAAWSDDGKRFIYLEQTLTDKNSTDSIVAFDTAKHHKQALASYPAVNFSNSFFHTLSYSNLSSRVMEAIPTLPLTDQVIIPYRENGKINVALNGGTLIKPIELVSGADQLHSLPNPMMQSQYWGTDWYGIDHILIEWSAGQGEDKRLKLTVADANGGNVHTVDEDLDDITSMNFIYDKERPLLGFLGKIGEQVNLYMLDLDTGEQTLLVENVEDNGSWEVNFNPQQTWMSIRYSIIYPGGGQLYIRPEASNTLTKVDVDPRSNTIWSEDGEKIALITGDVTGRRELTIVGKDGRPTAHYAVSTDSSETIFPVRWSKCY